MECIILLVILAVFNLLWLLVLRDLSIYTGAWMLHNRSLCGCKLVIHLASKVFVLMWKHICNHFNINPGIWFEIGAPCLRNEAWRWQRSLKPVYKSNSSTWMPKHLVSQWHHEEQAGSSSLLARLILSFVPWQLLFHQKHLEEHTCGRLTFTREVSGWLMADGNSKERPQEIQTFPWSMETWNWFSISQIYPLYGNWLAAHICCWSKGCCFPSCPILRLQTHISALRSSRGVRGVVLSNQWCPDVNNIQTKTEQHWLTPADLSQGQTKLLSTTWKQRSGQT